MCNKHDYKIEKLELAYQIAKERNGECISTAYINGHTLMLWHCNICGYDWKNGFDHIKNGQWCRRCADNRHRLDGLAEAKKIGQERGGECKATVYVNTKTYMPWLCYKCGLEWMATLQTIKNGRWCPHCSKIKPKRKHIIEDCQKHAESLGGCCKSKTCAGVKYKVEWECGEGHCWMASVTQVLSGGTWCPECSSNKSQRQLGTILQKLLFNQILLPQYRGFDWQRTCKSGIMSFDFYIPDLKLAIEYDGIQHFKPTCFGGIDVKKADANLKYTRNRDRLKNKRVKKHPEDVAIFIRIPYTEPLTEENVIRILRENGIDISYP